MLQPIKNWLQNKALFIALAISLVIIALSLVNTAKLPEPGIKVSDKILHSTAYMGLMWSWLLVFRNKKSLKNLFIIFSVLVVFGMLLEVLQETLTTYRTADWRDVIANSFGLLIGIISFHFFCKNLLE